MCELDHWTVSAGSVVSQTVNLTNIQRLAVYEEDSPDKLKCVLSEQNFRLRTDVLSPTLAQWVQTTYKATINWEPLWRVLLLKHNCFLHCILFHLFHYFTKVGFTEFIYPGSCHHEFTSQKWNFTNDFGQNTSCIYIKFWTENKKNKSFTGKLNKIHWVLCIKIICSIQKYTYSIFRNDNFASMLVSFAS